MAWTVKSSVLHISLEDCVKKNVDVPRAIRSQGATLAELSVVYTILGMKMNPILCIHAKTEL